MARVRNTKLRAQRIALDYFKRSHPLRRWRLVLGLLTLLGAGGWIGFLAVASDLRPASPGPVATGHALIGDRCELCHLEDDASNRWLASTEQACRTCHETAPHQANERDTPPCSACHREHTGHTVLAAVPTNDCTGCHSDLPASAKGAVRSEVNAHKILSFAKGHPEFRVRIGYGPEADRGPLDATSRDDSQIKFSHAKHLQRDLPGPPGSRAVELACGDCHQAPLTATLAYGKKTPIQTPASAPAVAPAEEPQYFVPIRYDTHCATCHPHNFDARIDPAPHDTPYVVRRFLRGAYAQLVVDQPGILTEATSTRPSAQAAAPRVVMTADKWVKERIAAAEDLLFRQPCPDKGVCQRCQQCHVIPQSQRSDAETPTVVSPEIPLRWFPQSRFDHGVHRIVACLECHKNAKTSATAADVLVPGQATCQRCHHPEGASDRCSECHTYHAAIVPVDLDGPRSIKDFSASRDGGGT